MVKRPTKMGAPTRELVHFLPGSWWATSLLQRSGKTHGELDRLLTSQDKKPEPNGPLRTPLYRMRAIAEGRLELQLHRPNHAELRRKAQTEQPGSEAEFLSVTWDELIYASGFQRRQPFHLELVSNELIATLKEHGGISEITCDGILLTRDGIWRCGCTTHLDALGLLLMQKRLRPIPVFEMQDVFFIRVWLGQATDLPPFRANRDRILKAIEKAYPELGPLQGEDGVKYLATPDEFDRMLAQFVIKFSGCNQSLWISPYPKRERTVRAFSPHRR